MINSLLILKGRENTHIQIAQYNTILEKILKKIRNKLQNKFKYIFLLISLD
jgi:hypothetical protein